MNVRPTVLFATLYPPDPAKRSEMWVTELLLREYVQFRPEFDLRVSFFSAHESSLEKARGLMERHPGIPVQYTFIKTRHAGRRPEEISYCKEQLAKMLATVDFDYLLFMDADVWTSIRQVTEWMREIGDKLSKRFVKIKYCLKDRLSSPSHTLGAFFHHKEILTRTSYWKSIFPKKPDGTRKGAPDCCLHDFLIKQGCQKIVPRQLLTYHFINAHDANVYNNNKLSLSRNARHEINDFPLTLEPVSGTNNEGEGPRRELCQVGQPLVSAVLITGKDEARNHFAKISIRCFLEQTYPNKELVIINTGNQPVGIQDRRIRELRLNCDDSVRLGDLRNIGLTVSHGDWIIQWDDDDWYAPSRIFDQMALAQPGAANLLVSQIRYDFKANSAFVYTAAPGIHGTILHERRASLKYPNIAQGEDSAFLNQFALRNPCKLDPGIYVRLCHTANTRTSGHIMHEYAALRNHWALDAAHSELLQSVVLPLYDKRDSKSQQALPVGAVNPFGWHYLRTLGESPYPRVFLFGLSQSMIDRHVATMNSTGIQICREPECVYDIEKADGAAGWLITAQFERIDSLFPNSMFLCCRPAKAKLVDEVQSLVDNGSLERYSQQWIARNTVFGSDLVANANKRTVLDVCDKFHRRVERHFQNRKDSLIWLDENSELPKLEF